MDTKRNFYTEEAVKTNLDGTPRINKDALYFIDFSKMNRMEDLILILASIGFSFSPSHPHWNILQQFVNLDNPILPGQQSTAPDIKLPKLNKVNGTSK
jgi:hypothetical protein